VDITELTEAEANIAKMLMGVGVLKKIDKDGWIEYELI
jgi:hypothetical protein